MEDLDASPSQLAKKKIYSAEDEGNDHWKSEANWLC